jgi:hypothetical protein
MGIRSSGKVTGFTGETSILLQTDMKKTTLQEPVVVSFACEELLVTCALTNVIDSGPIN